MIFQPKTGNWTTFFVLIYFLNSVLLTNGKLIDQVYDECNQPTTSRLDLECIGFPRTASDCLTRRSCDMIAMLSVLPSTNGNHFRDKFNITLIGTHLRDASTHEMSFILDAAFAPTYNPGEGTYYNCSWTQKESTVEVVVKSPGQLVESIGTGIIEEDLLVCQWTLDRSSDAWPTDNAGSKIDLITRKVEVILYKDGSKSSSIATRLPIYKSRYLFNDCDHPDVKYCLGSPYCVDAAECHELLTVIQSKNKVNSLDFNLYSFDYVTNNSFYDVTLYASDDSPGLQVICGKYSIESFFVFNNGSRDVSTPPISSMFTHVDPEFDGLRCNWTLPQTFKISGVTFDMATVKYLVKLRHSPNVYVDKAPIALPGFNIGASLYKSCSIQSNEKQCYGLDVANYMQDCFATRSCQAFAIFTVEDEVNWSTFVEPKMILDLYAAKSLLSSSSSTSTSSPPKQLNMSLSVSIDNDMEAKTVYKCLYTSEGRKVPTIEYPYRPKAVRTGSIISEADWIRCQWIWFPNGTNWPTNNRSEIIDLVNQRPSLQFTVDTTKKNLTKSVTLPIYKLRYFYQECDKIEDNLCLQSEPGCLETSSCTSLVHMKKHHGDTIDVEIFLTQQFDRLELIYTDQDDNSVKIECYQDKGSTDASRIFDESFKTAKSEQYQPMQTQFTKYSESRRFKMGFSRCSWLQEKQLSVGPFVFNSEINRYNVKLTVTSYEGLVARYSWDNVAIVGFNTRETQSASPSFSFALSPSNGWLTVLSLFSFYYYYKNFVSFDYVFN